MLKGVLSVMAAPSYVTDKENGSGGSRDGWYVNINSALYPSPFGCSQTQNSLKLAEDNEIYGYGVYNAIILERKLLLFALPDFDKKTCGNSRPKQFEYVSLLCDPSMDPKYGVYTEMKPPKCSDSILRHGGNPC